MSAGILQGSAMSDVLFVAILDAPVGAMDAASKRGGFGVARTCADDLGVVARRKEALLRLRRAFAVARAVVGLRLQPDSAS